MNKNYSLVLNIDRNYISSPSVLELNQYEDGAVLQCSILDGNAAFSGTGVRMVTLEMTKTDGKGVIIEGTLSGNTATFTLTKQFTAASGRAPAEIVFYGQGDNRLSTINFIVYVEPAPVGDSTDISDSELAPIIDLARSNQAAAEEAQRLAEIAQTGSEDARDQAEGYKNDAATSANAASGSASAASGSASAASSSASSAQQSAGNSSAYAAQAMQYRNQAEEYKDAAAGYAGAATYSLYVDTNGIMNLAYKEESEE